MFGTNWKTSERLDGVTVTHDVKIKMSDGIALDADIFRPDNPGKFACLLGVHAYDKAMQSTPSVPQAMQGQNAQAEAGDPNFYARRGYAHAIVNARGTGQSEGRYSHYGARDVEDIREVIAWLAAQDWCDGNVGMFGASYFSVAAKQVAATNPPALKAVWAMYGYTDFYRDKFYHGGILARSFLTSWARHLANVRVDPWSRANLGDEEFARRLTALQKRSRHYGGAGVGRRREIAGCRRSPAHHRRTYEFARWPVLAGACAGPRSHKNAHHVGRLLGHVWPALAGRISCVGAYQGTEKDARRAADLS
ncbi:MAG: CocE/NonD family hydrolase [Xanthobacteraceae bacterium]